MSGVDQAARPPSAGELVLSTASALEGAAKAVTLGRREMAESRLSAAVAHLAELAAVVMRMEREARDATAMLAAAGGEVVTLRGALGDTARHYDAVSEALADIARLVDLEPFAEPRGIVEAVEAQLGRLDGLGPAVGGA